MTWLGLSFDGNNNNGRVQVCFSVIILWHSTSTVNVTVVAVVKS